MNIIEFNKKLETLGFDYTVISNYLGINLSTFYRKINGSSDFTRNEIQLLQIKMELSPDEVFNIFFANELA